MTKTKKSKRSKRQLDHAVIRTFGDEKDVDALKIILREYGIYYNGKVFLTLWETAFNINNTWRSEIFVNKNRFTNLREHGGKWALQDYDLPKLFAGIGKALMLTDDITMQVGKNGIEFIVAKSSVERGAGKKQRAKNALSVD